MARGQLVAIELEALHRDPDRRLSPTPPRAPSSRPWRRASRGSRSWRSAPATADRDYLGRLASSEHASIFARSGELVQTFGHIARVIAEGGRGLRVLS